MQTVTMQTVTCRVVGGGCGDGGITVQDFEGACMFIDSPGTGGSSTTSTGTTTSTSPNDCAGMAATDACEGCVYGSCCPQYDACSAAVGAECQTEIGYWQGLYPPPASASTSPEIQQLSACIASLCGTVCTHYHRGPRPEPPHFDTRAP
jgi:hypothetical protein